MFGDIQQQRLSLGQIEWLCCSARETTDTRHVHNDTTICSFAAICSNETTNDYGNIDDSVWPVLSGRVLKPARLAGQFADGLLDGVVGGEGDANSNGSLHPVHAQPFEEAAPPLRAVYMRDGGHNWMFVYRV